MGGDMMHAPPPRAAVDTSSRDALSASAANGGSCTVTGAVIPTDCGGKRGLRELGGSSSPPTSQHLSVATEAAIRLLPGNDVR